MSRYTTRLECPYMSLYHNFIIAIGKIWKNSNRYRNSHSCAVKYLIQSIDSTSF